MIKNVNLSIILSLLILTGSTRFSLAQKGKDKEKAPAATPLLEISTDMGIIKVRLFDQTPLHRDNFLKLAGQGFYDSLLFHRVISAFMIQGGDPDSKNAAPGIPLGNGDVGYTIPAEFNDSLIHKKGALCAARTENPTKASSGCQFYIVQGKTFTDDELNQMEERISNQRKQSVKNSVLTNPANAAIREKVIELQKAKQTDSLKTYFAENVQPLIDKEAKPFKYTEEQRNIYKTTGGTPHLDQGYTVFGEVVEGLDVLDKIASTAVGANDRPVNDVRMKVKIADKGK
jgi:cyclophilin family peptidyl-prolyl cis-trans isomerase